MAKHNRRTHFSLKIVFVLFVCCLGENQRRRAPNEADCSKPPIPANGRVVKLKVIHRVKVAYYKCNVGYTRKGPEFRVCRQGQGWSVTLKCDPLPTTPTTPIPQLKKDMNKKLQKDLQTIAKDMEDIEGTGEGRALTAVIVALFIVIGFLVIHCCSLFAKRKSLKARYNEIVESGENPSREIPTVMEVSMDLFRTTLCCLDSNLPTTFKKKKKKKKRRLNQGIGLSEDVDETTKLVFDTNNNITTERPRDKIRCDLYTRTRNSAKLPKTCQYFDRINTGLKRNNKVEFTSILGNNSDDKKIRCNATDKYINDRNKHLNRLLP